MDSSKRVADAKAPRKEAPAADMKRLQKFYAADRPPRKRLRTLLDFLKHPPGAEGASGGGNIAVAVQSLLSGASKEAAGAANTGPEHAAAVADFWSDANNSTLVFGVVNDCVTELETLYTPHETAFRKQRRKPLEAEDWSEVFEGLEVLLRNNAARLREGWNNNGLTMLFAKLLKRDNHSMIKKYAFRCLALYTDATRNIQQLSAMPSTSTSSFQASRAGSIRLMSDGIEIDIDEDEGDARGTAMLSHAMPNRKNMHLELLRESVDFSPYGGGSIMLPDKFLNEGVHVEGWMRPMPTQAEEPVDMLKFLMDLSLEREDGHAKLAPLSATGKPSGSSDRFIFWAELIMKFYMPLLYPKVCLKVKLKEEGDTLGFFHHCPGSFQRVVARWVYKLRSKEDFMEVLWSRREFSEVIMETIRQRFAYRDTELVVDAIKFYSGICTGAQYVPSGMKAQMNECSRAMISHVSQLFHPSVQLDDSKILLHCIELLELVSQRRLDDYTSTYLRKFVLSTIDNCTILRDPSNRPVLTAMLSIVLHVWMHSAVVAKATGAQMWMELTIAIRRWLVNPGDAKVVGVEMINCWKRELRFSSCLLMYVMDKGYSYLKVTPEGAMLLPQNGAGGKDDKKSSVLFSLNLEGLNILVPAYLYAVDEIIIGNIWSRAEKSKVKSSEWNNELNAALDVVFAILELPKRFPDQDFVRWRQKIQGVCGIDEISLMQDIIDEIPETLDEFHVIIGRILVRIAQLPFTDVVDIKKRALWGIYCLVVMNLKPSMNGGHAVDPIHLAEWVVHLVDVCQNMDFSISMAALSILQDMSDYHEEINAFEPSLVARIVMTLAVFAQQQVEEASIEVQAAMERMGAADTASEHSGSGTKSASFTGSSLTGGSHVSGPSGGARRGSDNPRASRVEGSIASNPGEATDAFSKLKSKLKPGAPNAPASAPSPVTNSPVGEATSVAAQKEQEIPALRLIVQKTSAIFECLRFWLMHRTEVLQDADVKKLIFSAIEAALVGTLPDGEWQREVERARTLERRMSMPLLFLGLQMRASLNNEPGHAGLKCFEETAVAAEGLLMHLLHHINGFPSAAGVDQMVSDCSELTELDASRDNGEDDSPPAALSFVFMDSIVFSVVGSLDSPCARFIVRDMTGLFTWEITPGVMPRGGHSLTSWIGAGSAGNKKLDVNAPVERELTLQTDMITDSLALHHPTGAVQVEFKHTDEVGGICKTCGGEKPRTKAAPSDAKGGRSNASSGIKLEARQVSWEQEQDNLSNNVCPIKSSYVFHEDGSSSSTSASTKEGGDSKKKEKSRSSEVEKMPGSGNKDERQERLERIAKQHEERNNTGTSAQPTPEPQKVVCHCPPQSESKFKRRTTTTICGLFDMSINEPNVGSLDDERCLLDLVLDSIPMVFRDCGGDTTDKTLLGGRYSMMRYNLMDLMPSSNPLLMDSAEASGFSFLQRLIHDEECYSQLKNFLTKEENTGGKELVEFCDAVKKYERSSVPTDRLGQATVIYWEFLTVEGGKKLIFPTAIVSDIQEQIHKAQSALRAAAAVTGEDPSAPKFCLPGSLFQHAMAFVEYEGFEKSGLLDKYVAALDQPATSSSTAGSTSASNGKSSSSTPSIPPQLALFDSFSIMEVNARVSHLALQKRNSDEQLVKMTKPGVTAERLMDVSNSSLKDSRVSALDICRLFLSQAGLLPSPDGDSKKKSTLKLLEHGPKLERSLRHLDKSPTRETMKIGVIYVGKRQHTQQEILHNEKGSRAYESFLSQLGWKVDMQTHRGFVGGLDTNPKSLSNGKTTLYYATSHSEVMFHVVTMMPTKASDPQQIDKKRHVGNDYVHIVWSDNAAQAYDPSTITSHFNDVQIVIYPLRKAQRGLYLIKIHTKDKVPPFGPLQSGMVVHQSDLARLVRQTAMNANRVCRSQTMLYVRPYPTRKKLVDEIVERYAVEYKESQLLTMLFGNSASTSASIPTPSAGTD
ncbi:hypothetical protein PHYSODRAFT_332215 [Phytophthora sojae]|uniref:Rap-GAP domain-containing protein n=1 Tax=Phytophthora sojae (strain P6497) TaxID=1094619 RepID=G4ZEF6_PHYSP|nr:hypothetical protein PHYSODRAFT_332215 [Phytophthora sojae]EGZ18421.1 hypothetical protein PHYSODRAFT_332215 [Phytophthora sojae]|eukprot:XP_009527479.1 hypothetical protein PHYSODRAFT_332215 [Phytophthora sojae]